MTAVAPALKSSADLRAEMAERSRRLFDSMVDAAGHEPRDGAQKRHREQAWQRALGPDLRRRRRRRRRAWQAGRRAGEQEPGHEQDAAGPLFNWLAARATAGKFIQRIDDTDAERNIPETEQPIFEGLQWLGRGWDELYRQSERAHIYQACADHLLSCGHTYTRGDRDHRLGVHDHELAQTRHSERG
jgi:hypothetical protein